MQPHMYLFGYMKNDFFSFAKMRIYVSASGGVHINTHKQTVLGAGEMWPYMDGCRLCVCGLCTATLYFIWYINTKKCGRPKFAK